MYIRTHISHCTSGQKTAYELQGTLNKTAEKHRLVQGCNRRNGLKQKFGATRMSGLRAGKRDLSQGHDQEPNSHFSNNNSRDPAALHQSDLS